MEVEYERIEKGASVYALPMVYKSSLQSAVCVGRWGCVGGGCNLGDNPIFGILVVLGGVLSLAMLWD